MSIWGKPITFGGGSNITIEGITITENGTYTAPTGVAYSPVIVAVSATGLRVLVTTLADLYEIETEGLMTWTTTATGTIS